MDNSIPDIPPLCELCNDAVMTVKHILVECDTLREARRRILGKEDVDMKMLLGSIIGKKMICFVKSIGLYDRV